MNSTRHAELVSASMGVRPDMRALHCDCAMDAETSSA
jgi:hypothetical protein